MRTSRRKVLLAVAAPIALVMLILGGLALHGWSADRKLEASWRRSLGGASFLERYPKTEDNETLLELERLGASMGLSMAPGDEPGRPQPSPEAAEHWAAIAESFRNLLEEARGSRDGTPPVVPADIRAFLEEARPTLDRGVALLLEAPPPAWRMDLEDPPSILPNFGGALGLGKLLTAEALVSYEAGDDARGDEILEALWVLNTATLDRPELVAQLIAQALVRYEILILRMRPALSEPWRTRLTNLDLHSRRVRAFRLESFFSHQSGRSWRSGRGSELGWLGRWSMRDWARRFDGVVDEALKVPVHEFDPNAFLAGESAKIPRWNVPALLMMPNFWDLWPRAAYVDLAAELTVLADDERRRLASGDPNPPPPRRPAHLDGLGWRYEPNPEGTVLTLDGSFRYPGPKPLPLEMLVTTKPGD